VHDLSGHYLSSTPKSRKLYERAQRVLPAGVSYFLRYIEPYPFYTARAKGSRLYDVDGNDYIDFWIGHYSLILGHSPPKVMREVRRQINKGSHYGTAHVLEIALAEQVTKMIPSAQMVRFTNSGTEAAMYATRLARAVTGRNLVCKFAGGWHGGYDALHTGVKQPFDVPESGGLTEGALQDTGVLPYNEVEPVRKRLKKDKVAAIFVEPLMVSGGCIPAQMEFLKALRELCTDNGTLLIFDEVITGFRLAPGGGQQYSGVKPDVTLLGKILGGGFPIGAIAASTEIMQHMNPLQYPRPKFAFHGGTFTGNPVTMVAGLATLKALEDGKIIHRLNKRGDYVRQELRDIFERKKMEIQVSGISSLWHTHFMKERPLSAVAIASAQKEKLVRYHMHLIENGVFFLPGKAGALSTAHTKADLDKLLSQTESFSL
jgi:glutamate-1-semialdehyde 2,1-aminomutase